MLIKMLIPDRTGQAAAGSNMKWDTDLPLTTLLWLPRVRTICMTCCKHLMGVSAGRIQSPTNRIDFKSGRNWTVHKYQAYLVYFQELRQK